MFDHEWLVIGFLAAIIFMCIIASGMGVQP